MAFRKRAGFILALLLSVNTWADNLQINPAHPDHYTVVKHDTLWDIAGRFLQHPWQWTNLWRTNRQIINPNLIYPGDTIHLTMVNGQPQMQLSRSERHSQYNQYSQPTHRAHVNRDGTCLYDEDDTQHERIDVNRTANGKLSPCIRESDVEQPIDLIPLDKIASFLRSPKVVGANDLNSSPYIIDFAGEHLMAGAGDKIYVRAILNKNVASYTVYRAGNPYISPNTGEILGYEAEHIADATLQQAGDPASLLIDKTKREILMGDRLMPQVEESLTLNYFPQPPNRPVHASIISIMGGVNQIGKNDVVVIDKGTRDGLAVGHELVISQSGRVVRDNYSGVRDDTVKLPDEVAGTLMVFRPFEKVSYALVMKASLPIHVLDTASTP